MVKLIILFYNGNDYIAVLYNEHRERIATSYESIDQLQKKYPKAIIEVARGITASIVYHTYKKG